MTPRDFVHIFNTWKSSKGTFHVHNGTKTTLVILPADAEASWCLLPSSVSFLSCRKVQPDNTYSCTLNMTGQVWESQENDNHKH